MGCSHSKGSRAKRRGKVGKLAAAFEERKPLEPTFRQKEVEDEKRIRAEQLGALKNQSMKEKRKKAEAGLEKCFKEKPPTGGIAPSAYRT